MFPVSYVNITDNLLIYNGKSVVLCKVFRHYFEPKTCNQSIYCRFSLHTTSEPPQYVPDTHRNPTHRPRTRDIDGKMEDRRCVSMLFKNGKNRKAKPMRSDYFEYKKAEPLLTPLRCVGIFYSCRITLHYFLFLL